MAVDVAPDTLWSRLSELIAHKTGLHFPAERHADLLRGLTGAAQELGFADAAECAEGLLASQLTPEQLHVLAGHLTIGETYFFRDRSTFDALAEHVLPELIRRRGAERRLSVWSAACCTGEEAYSLAILLQHYLPNWRDWQITLLATDINERFLEKARAGVYGEWSFRDAPAGLKARHFARMAEGRYALLPQIKQLVRFARFNLVEDSFLALGLDLPAMDLILCRNVLMYFTPAQADKVVSNLHGLLREDGWLIVAATEGSHSLMPRFSPVNFPGAILYQKATSQPHDATARVSTLVDSMPFETPIQVLLPPVPEVAPAAPPSRAPEEVAVAAGDDVEAIALEARSLANQGRLAEALIWCDRWITADSLDGAGRYLRAVILQELGEREQARRAFQQTVYLQPDFVLAHVALGNLARAEGRRNEGNKHFGNALALLRRCEAEDVLPQSDGLTVGRLLEIVVSLLDSAATT